MSELALVGVVVVLLFVVVDTRRLGKKVDIIWQAIVDAEEEHYEDTDRR